MNKNKYYAVLVGVKTGIYSNWFGKDGAQIQVKGFSGAIYKGFNSIEEAEEFMEKNTKTNNITYNNYCEIINSYNEYKMSKNVKIYTDGCSLGNPGPGGCGVVIIQNGVKREISVGFRYTTNNRMELMACIIGLGEFKKKTNIKIYSDSKYVIDGICKGWAKKWRKNKWMKNKKEKAKNCDLWEKLLQICSNHQVNFIWIKGHNGNINNEICDKLANIAATNKNLKIDKGYNNNKTLKRVSSSF